ncbi:ankyrin repeat domain-containing protein [uncultured Hoeflea sp.]|mgnify:FL=1|uniref:ankyrin repeat domain-containing protein n=1 Tax=uncultured Hoeflea sp. TaxID=538666 RepID=UPI0030DD399E
MTKSIDQLRRDAKSLKKAHLSGDIHARQRIANHPPRPEGEVLKHADYLHVIARENNFASWSALKLAAELYGLDTAARKQRLRIALFHGQAHVINRLLSLSPDLADGQLGLQIALYDRTAVSSALRDDPSAATRLIGLRSPLCHLAFSRYIHQRPDLADDMIAIAEMLVENGASVDESMSLSTENDHQLSVLYGAIGHGDNMVLGRWLLEKGANPNDNESLYHATELGHHEGLRMLLEHGANPRGTNALLRAMDFDDITAVRMLLDAGALADEFDGTHVGGERPWVIPALHQAARRMSSPEMIRLLLDAGADPARQFEGCSCYGYARVFGNQALAREIEKRGAAPQLTSEETLLAMAADGADTQGRVIDAERLPEAYRNIIRTILHLPGKLDHIKRLVALGIEADHPDAEGLTPVQAAGWEGLPEVMGYLLSLGPNLSHQNGYGGTLLSTIMHGSENCPQKAARDHVGCLQLALDAGIAVPRNAADMAGSPEIASLLAAWCDDHPERLVDGGPL